MKGLFLLGALTTTGLAQSVQTANFTTNTNFTGPFGIGTIVPLTWTAGNGASINLTIANATWAYQIFAGHDVVPTTYGWYVTSPPGFVPGNYRLALQQTGGGTSLSPVFAVIDTAGTTTTTSTTTTTMTTTMTTSVAAATITFVYWDIHCGCTKTGSALAPLNTNVPVTTIREWDEQCGCHTDTVWPVTAHPAANNYTAPPLVTASSTQSAAQTPSPTASFTPATFKGEGIRLGGSISGALLLIAAMAFI